MRVASEYKSTNRAYMIEQKPEIDKITGVPILFILSISQTQDPTVDNTIKPTSASKDKTEQE